ncbi:unnamed protein product [Cuscuta campestris]|uniref:Reverse transcriptase Ty1/copia-type domain-containing protein n=1 Tax=Cuscuta campestris TaxID=132261 RepID=A0A484NE15_9ASTE|nr:unnamed protein product [Cuscuta campestris]
MSVICLSLTKNVAFNILKEKTAKGIMDALSTMYEKPSAANKVFLIRELVNTRMKNGTSITEHINKLNSILARLLSVGIKFDDEVQALLLLSSLPDSWSGTVTAVTSSAGPDGFTFEKIHDLVLGEDVRRRSSGESLEESLNIVRESNVDSWVMDFGASFHATYNGEALQNLVVVDFRKIVGRTGIRGEVQKRAVKGLERKSCHGPRKELEEWFAVHCQDVPVFGSVRLQWEPVGTEDESGVDLAVTDVLELGIASTGLSVV